MFSGKFMGSKLAKVRNNSLKGYHRYSCSVCKPQALCGNAVELENHMKNKHPTLHVVKEDK
jgi:hypothetical protein